MRFLLLFILQKSIKIINYKSLNLTLLLFFAKNGKHSSVLIIFKGYVRYECSIFIDAQKEQCMKSHYFAHQISSLTTILYSITRENEIEDKIRQKRWVKLTCAPEISLIIIYTTKNRNWRKDFDKNGEINSLVHLQYH